MKRKRLIAVILLIIIAIFIYLNRNKKEIISLKGLDYGRSFYSDEKVVDKIKKEPVKIKVADEGTLIDQPLIYKDIAVLKLIKSDNNYLYYDDDTIPQYYLYSSPVRGDEITVYNRDISLAAVDLKSGSILYRLNLEYTSYSPLLYKNKLIYSNKNYLKAVDIRTGEEKWFYRADSEICSIINEGDIIYFNTMNSVYAVNANSGSLLWNEYLKDSYGYLTLNGIYLTISGGNNKGIYFFNPTNKGKNIRIPKEMMYVTNYCLNKKVMLISGYTFNGSNKIKLTDNIIDLDIWEFESKGKILYKLALSDKYIATSCYAGNISYVNLYDYNKNLIWEKTIEGFISNPVIVRNFMYIGTNKGLFCYDLLKGNEILKFEGVKAGIPNIIDGKIYFGGGDGYLYILD